MEETKSDDDINEDKSGWLLPALVFAFVILAWAITLFTLKDFENRGTFGDMFGAVNALFSGLAFAGVIFAILLQRKELQLQRKELSLTRAELKAQRQEFSEQNKTLKQQRFENTFFQMLSLHNEIIDSMKWLDSNNVLISQGRDVFKKIASSVEGRIDKTRKEEKKLTFYQLITKSYELSYNNRQSLLGHYFRVLYRIIKFVHDSDIEDKKFYTDIVRAQLSNQELQLLFYNCLSSLGCKKFKPLVEEYALLNNLPPNSIYDPQNTLPLYKEEAYGGEIPPVSGQNKAA